MAVQGFYNAMLGGSDYVATGGASLGSSCFELEEKDQEGWYVVKNCELAIGSKVISCKDTSVQCTDGYIFCMVTFSQNSESGDTEATLTVSAGQESSMKTSLVQFSRPLYRVDSDGTVVDMRWGPQLLMMY
jgi:hypothetical protein